MATVAGDPEVGKPRQGLGLTRDTTAVLTDSAAKCSALKLLIQSHDYATLLGRSNWDFAVEIYPLRCRHLNNNDFRWLVCAGYVQHACEVSAVDEQERRFCFEGELRFSPRSCFVLTRSGAEFIRRALRETDTTFGCSGSEGDGQGGHRCAAIPTWHPQRRELWMGESLVKRFRVPAAIQERILAALQEEDWPERIDDPLPPNGEIEPKRHLHTAIHSLNRNQVHPLIHFRGDGSGTGIIWEPR